MNGRLPVRRVAGAGRGVGACGCTEGCACRRRAGDNAATIWEVLVLLALAVIAWWVMVNWPFGRREHSGIPNIEVSDLIISNGPRFDTVPAGWERHGEDVVALTNNYVQIGSNGLEALDPRWLAVLVDIPWMDDGERRTLADATNVFTLETVRLNGTNLTVVTRILKDPTNEVVMWIEHDSVGGAKMTWPEEPTRWPWWATVIVAGLAGAGLFGAGYGWGRWVEAGWWHRKRGEIE